MIARPHLARLIGESLSPDPDVEEPLCTHTTSGRRLADLLPGDYESDYSRENLLDFRVRVGCWRKWHRDRARAAATRLLSDIDLVGVLNLILLGRQVAEAFGLVQPSRMYSRRIFAPNGVVARVIVIPHPSGLNRWWNEAASARLCRLFLRGALSC